MGYYEQGFSNIGGQIGGALEKIAISAVAKSEVNKNKAKGEKQELDVINQQIETANLQNDMLKEEKGIAKQEKSLQTQLNKFSGDPNQWSEKYKLAHENMVKRVEAMSLQRKNFETRKKLVQEKMDELSKMRGSDK